jgi:hypothetical protein
LAFHPFMAGRAKRILAATALRAFRRRSRRHAFSCRACPVCVRFRQRTQRFSPLRRAQARNPRKPQHASNQLLDPAPNLILSRFPINPGTARKELEWFRKWCLCAGWAPKARWCDGSGYSPGAGRRRLRGDCGRGRREPRAYPADRLRRFAETARSTAAPIMRSCNWIVSRP